MNAIQDEDPFKIVKDYRQMVARRDRNHKKRKQKLYPPTTIKTRSMEQKQEIITSQEMLDLEHYSDIVPKSSSWNQTESLQLFLLTENDREIENSMDIQALSLGQGEKPLDQDNVFFFWENEVNNDLNDHELLSIH